MIAHPSFTDSIEARVAAHDNYMLASIPPYKDMRAACMTKANCARRLNFWQAMSCPDVHVFVEAMQVVMDQMDKVGAWELINKSKVKRTPDEAVKKRKI
eukprot:6544312-Ditylum_brightwellii.AAC.2